MTATETKDELFCLLATLFLRLTPEKASLVKNEGILLTFVRQLWIYERSEEVSSRLSG
jgi:hypothetical protein